jgi:hypothetical protein
MRIRDFIGATARAGAEQEQQRGFRKLLSGAARLAKTNPAEMIKMTAGMGRLMTIESDELETWVEPGDLVRSDDLKKFDVCDLRIWLELAEAAGIDAIPAQTVATLSEEELGALLGNVQVPEQLRHRISEGMISDDAKEVTSDEAQGVLNILQAIEPDQIDPNSEHPGQRGFAKMESALDEIPSSWMVRTHLAGSGNLKALVGCGLMEKGDDTAKVSPEFEIGGGWVRAGNRRMIDFSDPRFVQTAIGGHKTDVHYLARPWATPGRFHEGEDLHRANTPLAGPGKWPAEWRVFVKSGEVTGVANYYGWTGEGASPENAWNAIEAAAAGQVIVDEAVDRNLAGVFMAQVFMRSGDQENEQMQEFMREWPEDKMHATLDFLETEDGLQFLEAGPAHQPGGGGHPCAFAGQNVEKALSASVAACEGVAYLTMPNVHLGEPSTWQHGETEGYIDGWSQAAERAIEHAPLSDRAREFLTRFNVNLDVEESLDM